MKKFRIRKTGEIIDVVSFGGNSIERDSASDFVSYIDSKGIEHYKEPLNYYWDLEEIESTEIHEIKKDIDWEQRRYELAKAAMQGLLNATSVERFTLRIKPSTIADASIEYADALIKELKK